MRWIKRLLLVLAIIVLIFVGAAVLLVTLVDPNDYKPLIVEEVHKATGRQLTLQGDIELSFFPWLGLRLGSAQLSNAKGFGDAPFAAIEEAQVRVALLPLIKGEVKADTIRLNGLTANLSTNKQGVANWDDLVTQGEASTQPEPAEEPSEGKAAPLALAIGGVEIHQAALRWQDAQSATDVSISPFNLETGALAIGEPFAIDMDFRLVNREPQVEAQLTLGGQVTLDLERQHYQLSDLQLDIAAQGAVLPPGKLEATLKTSIDADLQNQVARVTPLTIEAMSLKLNGEIEATQLLGDVQIKGQLNSDPFSPRELLKRLGQPTPPTADAKVLNKAKMDLAFAASPTQATMSQLNIVLDDTQITGNAQVKSFQDPHIGFNVDIDQIDVDRYLPPKQESSKQDKPEQKPITQPETDDKLALPVETLRALNIDGQVKIGQLKAANLRLVDVEATLTAKQGLIEIKPVKTSLYGGHVQSSVKIDVRRNVPAFGITTNLKNVQMGDLIYDLQQDQAYLRGTSNLNFNLNTQGDRISVLKKQLGGTLNLAVTEGALRDRELAAKIEAVIAFLRRRDPAPSGEEIIFDSLTSSAKINKGVLRNDDLSFVTPLILTKGQGTVNIGNDTIDYRLGVALAGGDKNKKRFFVPITIKGPFTDLDYGLDLANAAKEQLKEEVDQKKQEVKEKADQKIKQKQQELEDKLKEKLKLF